jgi:hypothetical protein
MWKATVVLSEISVMKLETLQKKQKDGAFVTPELDHSASKKRRLQIPALAGRLIWLRTRWWCSPDEGL